MVVRQSVKRSSVKILKLVTGKLPWASFTSLTAPVYNVIANKKKKATLQYSIYAACKQHCSIHYIITCVVVFFHFLFFFFKSKRSR